MRWGCLRWRTCVCSLIQVRGLRPAPAWPAGSRRRSRRGEASGMADSVARSCSQAGMPAQADDVAMRAGDRGHAHGVRHALAIRLAVAGEAEHRLDQRLELQRGADYAVEHDGLVAVVPELVGGAGLDDGALAALELDALATDAQVERALDRGEGLGLAWDARGRRRRRHRAGRRRRSRRTRRWSTRRSGGTSAPHRSRC